MTDIGAPLKTEQDEAQFKDFVELLKPRVMRLVVFTALVGLLAAPNTLHPLVAFVAILSIAVGGEPLVPLICGGMRTSMQ